MEREMAGSVRAAATLGMIMPALDATITRVFGSPPPVLQWLLAAYLLALAVAVPVGCRAVDRFGGKRVWLCGLLVFTGASALCGLAWSASSLVVFRVLQGFAGGLVMPAGNVLVARAFRLRRAVW